MELHDQSDHALDYEAKVRSDGVIDIPGEPPAPRGPGISKGTALILLGLLIAYAGWAYGGMVAMVLVPTGAGLSIVVSLLMLGLPRLGRRSQSTAINTSLRRNTPGMKGEL
ncbi:MAG: hypothetical protein ABR601_01880 [Parasphingopyxis sp.]|nr:hypothetical protein [Sphingomonadales bacterium]